MKSGLLNEIITIQRPVTVKNKVGEVEQTFKDLKNTRSEVQWNTGKRSVTNDEIVFDWTKTFNVRRYVDIQETDRIKWKDHLYRILSIEDNRQWNQKTIFTELINE